MVLCIDVHGENEFLVLPFLASSGENTADYAKRSDELKLCYFMCHKIDCVDVPEQFL